MPENDSRADVLLVTATPVESHEVMNAFELVTMQRARPERIDGRVYQNLGEVNGARVYLAISQMGSGGIGASQQTVQRAIAALRPQFVIMVGIAFGVDSRKQAIGDVLVSRQLWLYDLQKVDKDQRINPRGDRPHASGELLNLFDSAYLHWARTEWRDIVVRFGLVLTGETLVDNIDYRDQLRQFEREAIGGEMEGAGLYVACQDANPKVDWILVKGICDWADGSKAQDKEARQRLAASNAANLVLHTLQHVSLARSPAPAAPAPPPRVDAPNDRGATERVVDDHAKGLPMTPARQIKVLFLAANPEEETRLALGEEIRSIEGKIRLGDARDRIRVEQAWAVRFGDLLQQLNQHRPEIVHFSGHGSEEGELILVNDRGESHPVNAATLRRLFTTLKDNIRLVLLNACYSRVQGEAITEVIEFVVGMRDEIGDEAARVFAAQFYSALTFHRSVQEAFDQGVLALMGENTAEEDIPDLLVRPGVDAATTVLVPRGSEGERPRPF